MKITTRKLADITLANEYLRTDTDVSDLKKSLASVGLIHPVTVSEGGELLAGARRYQAAKELGWDELPVHVVDHDALVQELISIDENLVRTALGPLELEQYLNRGREIYESLHPEAHKVAVSAEPLTAEERARRREEDERDEDSFAAVTAGKTGLSRAVIQGAIRRDALAADAVKRARSEGELNATQTNELIKLDREAQERLLPLVADKTAKETRRIVEAARERGVAAAVEESEGLVPLPREYGQLISPVRRANRQIHRILAEELRYEGPERDSIHDELLVLRDNLEAYFRMAGVEH